MGCVCPLDSDVRKTGVRFSSRESQMTTWPDCVEPMTSLGLEGCQRAASTALWV
jgi:hypothetical protein